MTWDEAIKDADEEIRKLVAQLKRFRQAKRIFTLNKADGFPWPESQNSSARGETER
jgi:hypothetical protein